MDPEFEKCIISAESKWDMVAAIFKNGFVVKKRMLSGLDEDIIFPPLPFGENDITGTTIQRRWEKITNEYRELMLKKQSVDQQVAKRKHIGPKQQSDEILSEIMTEIEEQERKFKFLDDVTKCRTDKHT